MFSLAVLIGRGLDHTKKRFCPEGKACEMDDAIYLWSAVCAFLSALYSVLRVLKASILSALFYLHKSFYNKGTTPRNNERWFLFLFYDLVFCYSSLMSVMVFCSSVLGVLLSAGLQLLSYNVLPNAPIGYQKVGDMFICGTDAAF